MHKISESDFGNIKIGKIPVTFKQLQIFRSYMWENLTQSHIDWQRWSRGHKARGQGQGHKKKNEVKAKAKDSFSEDRHSRGQGQECSRPRPRTKDTSASALQNHKNFLGDLQKKKKKKVFTKIFLAISTKTRFPKNFSSVSQNFSNSKNSAVLEPRTGQFSRTWGLEAQAKDLTFEAKAKDFKMCPRGLHLCDLTLKTFC